MKFIRRHDLTPHTRIEMVRLAWLNQGIYGKMTQIAQDYHISRTFLYQLIWAANLRVSKNAVFGLNSLPSFWTRQISCIMPILTGFGPNPKGPKSGQGKLADLDALEVGSCLFWMSERLNQRGLIELCLPGPSRHVR